MSRRLAPVAVVCAVLLAGCQHRAPQTLAIAPAPPAIQPVLVSVPPPTHPTEPLPAPVTVADVAPAPAPPPPKKPRRKRVAVVPPAAPPPVQVAANTPPPAIEMGQLSAGGDAGSGLRSETEQMVNAQKQRIDHLAPALVAAHEAEVEQARRFLKSAEDAWKASDVEGAHTLALKAKVLLDDLQK